MAAFDTTLATLGIGRATSAATVQSAAKQTLGQDDFLKLMTAQLKNQDPFDPVDNTQMVAQMAQFSSLAGISEMNGTLKGIADKLGSTTAAEALGYAGRTVLVEGATAYGRASGGIAGAVELDADATDVTLQIAAADGTVLDTLSLGATAKGTATFDWDGKTAGGEDAGGGPFTITAFARSGVAPVTSRALVWAPVQSVSTTTGVAVLTLPGLGQVPVTAVRQVG